MQNMIVYKEGEISYARWIKKRIENNLNFLALASGSPGIGKSWAMLSLASSIDPTFSSEQVAFSFRGVMGIINSDWFKEKAIKIIVFDEAQIDLNARSWQSLINKLFNYLMSTFRHQNIIFLMTSPYLDFVDVATKKLIHCEFKVLGHDEKTKLTKLKPFLLQYSSEKGDFYKHSLMVIKDGFPIKQKFLYLKPPPKILVDEYEKKKTEFTSKLNQKIMVQLNSLEDKDMGVIPKDKVQQIPLTKFQQDVLDMLTTEPIKQKVIAEKLGRSIDGISDTLKSLRKKGFSIGKGAFLVKNGINNTEEPLKLS
jgi:hypothetical protein